MRKIIVLRHKFQKSRIKSMKEGIINTKINEIEEAKNSKEDQWSNIGFKN